MIVIPLLILAYRNWDLIAHSRVTPVVFFTVALGLAVCEQWLLFGWLAAFYTVGAYERKCREESP